MKLYIDLLNPTIAIGLDVHIRRLCELVREKLQHLKLCEDQFHFARSWMLSSLTEELRKPYEYKIVNGVVVSYGIHSESWFALALKSTTDNFINSCITGTSIANDKEKFRLVYMEISKENEVWCQESIKAISAIMHDEVRKKLNRNS